MQGCAAAGDWTPEKVRGVERRGARRKRDSFFVERLRGLKTPQRIKQSRDERMEVAASYKKDFVSYPLGAKDTKTTDHLKNVLVIAAIHHIADGYRTPKAESYPRH